jgi:hypothetical protein
VVNDHVVHVIADHPAVVDLAGDLAGEAVTRGGGGGGW